VVITKGGKKSKEKTFEPKVPVMRVRKVVELKEEEQLAPAPDDAATPGALAHPPPHAQQNPVYEVKTTSMSAAPLRYLFTI